VTKGLVAEEALRRHFLSAGYYVLRSVPVQIADVVISDLDLWLYQRSSVITRERANVDVKHKRSPQVLERIVWARGLQEVLGLERAMVVTTDKRPESREFGNKSGVLVFDGNFLGQVLSHYSEVGDRITEEELLQKLDVTSVLERDINLRAFYDEHKRSSISAFNFNGTNKLLDAIGFLLNEHVACDGKCEAATRLIFFFSSLCLLTIDFSIHHLAFDEPTVTANALNEGLRYGAAGKRRADEVLQTALSLIASRPNKGLFEDETAVARELSDQLGAIPSQPLSEYVSRPDVARRLFTIAKMFESAAFSRTLPRLQDLPGEAKGLLGLLVDFHGIDRKQLL
jgi:hypothetical protein